MSQDTDRVGFEIEYVETFQMRTLYQVEADNRAHAIRAIAKGMVPRENAELIEGGKVFNRVSRVKQLDYVPVIIELAPESDSSGAVITTADESDIEHLLKGDHCSAAWVRQFTRKRA